MINLSTFSVKEIIILFFKAFSVIFGFMYLIYTLIVFKQTQIMSKTIQVIDTGVIKRENTIVFVSRLQMLVGLIIFVFSIIILFS